MSLAPGVDDGAQWTPDQDEMLKAFLSKSNAGVPGANPPGVTPPQAPIGVPSTPPVVGTPPPPPPDNDPESKIADSHPGNDALLKDIQSKEGQIDKYGPDQQKAVMDMIAKEQGGLGTKIGQAGSTLADGIMQGVARAGNPGFAKQYNENLQNKIKLQAGAVPQEQEMNASNMLAKQALEEKTSGSPLGASEALATKLVAQKMFPELTKGQLDNLTKNPQALQKMFPSIAEYNKAMAEIQNTAEFRRESLLNQRLGLAQTGERAKAETVQGAARGLESRSMLQKVKDAFVTSPETKALENQAAGGSSGGRSFNTEAEAEAAGLPAGTVVTIGGRRARVR